MLLCKNSANTPNIPKIAKMVLRNVENSLPVL